MRYHMMDSVNPRAKIRALSPKDKYRRALGLALLLWIIFIVTAVLT